MTASVEKPARGPLVDRIPGKDAKTLAPLAHMITTHCTEKQCDCGMTDEGVRKKLHPVEQPKDGIDSTNP
jgi:hypothetical protein